MALIGRAPAARDLHRRYSAPRRFNYLLGMSLLVGAVLLDFTGYMLRWDQGIQWALVVGTNLLKTIPLIGEALLSRGNWWAAANSAPRR